LAARPLSQAAPHPSHGGTNIDAKQQPTACGVATLDEKHDELIVVTAAH
jgi:hypothetical protein